MPRQASPAASCRSCPTLGNHESPQHLQAATYCRGLPSRIWPHSVSSALCVEGPLPLGPPATVDRCLSLAIGFRSTSSSISSLGCWRVSRQTTGNRCLFARCGRATRVPNTCSAGCRHSLAGRVSGRAGYGIAGYSSFPLACRSCHPLPCK